ncbi:hypothetical protein [Sediminibacterium sp.]|uniref:hypothetical protein n=1 Tax=Sediminibacterium sp. TaxID=1917865 RepID=UPI003F69F327
MVFLFRDKSIINILFVLLLCLLVHGHGFFLPVPVEANLNTGYFGFLLQHYLKPLLGTSGFWVYILIVMIQALRLNFLLAEQKMYPNSSYTVAMTYVLLTGLFPDWSVISPALLANFLLIWIYIKLTRLYNNPAPKTLLFNIGLLVAIMVLSYHPTALVVPVVLFALGIMRAFKLQEWFTLIMGMVLPYYFLVSGLYLTNQLSLVSNWLPDLEIPQTLTPLTKSEWIGLSAFLISFFIGLFYWQQFNSRLVIQMRKNWSSLLVMTLIMAIAPIAFHNAGFEAALLCLVPVVPFASASFSFPRRLLFPNLLFWLLLAAVMYNNWQIVKF